MGRKSAKKASTAKEKQPKAKRLKVDDQDDRNDYFSPIPHDCKLAVFKHLPRATLNALEPVNKCIGEAVNDPSIKRIKQKGNLFIFEERAGHSFRMDVPNQKKAHLTREVNVMLKTRWNSCVDLLRIFGTRLHYHVRRGETDGTRTSDNRPIMLNKLYPTLSHGLLYTTRCISKNNSANTPHPATPMPQQLFENAVKLLEQYSPNFITFDWVLIDDSFIDYARAVLQAATANTLTFHDVHFADSVNLRNFARLLIESGAKSIELRDHSSNHRTHPRFSDITAAFDEQFVIEYAASSASLLSLEIAYYDWPEASEKWEATPSIHPALCQFKHFYVYMMEIAQDNLIDLIMLRLQSVDEVPAKWKLHLTEIIKPSITKGRVDKGKFLATFKYTDDEPHKHIHQISLHGSSFMCEIRPKDDEWVDVIFMEDEDEYDDSDE